MSLNIKNEHTHELVRELAKLTGMSQTSAVEEAVRRWLEELRAADTEAVERRVDNVMRTLSAFHAELTDEDREAIRQAHEDLYDERGLPQ